MAVWLIAGWIEYLSTDFVLQHMRKVIKTICLFSRSVHFIAGRQQSSVSFFLQCLVCILVKSQIQKYRARLALPLLCLLSNFEGIDFGIEEFSRGHPIPAHLTDLFWDVRVLVPLHPVFWMFPFLQVTKFVWYLPVTLHSRLDQRPRSLPSASWLEPSRCQVQDLWATRTCCLHKDEQPWAASLWGSWSERS